MNWSKLFSCAAGEARGREREGETAYCRSQPERGAGRKPLPTSPHPLRPVSVHSALLLVSSVKSGDSSLPPVLIPSPNTEGLTKAKTVSVPSYAESR